MLEPKRITTNLGVAFILKKIGKGKSGYCFLADLNNQKIVVKLMHNEPCPYYTFSENKVQSEVRAYHILQKIGIPIPQLLDFNISENYLVKTYLDGKCGHEWLVDGEYDEEVIRQLFLIARQAELHKINIDYFPTNFVILNRKIYYIDYEINSYSKEWSFEEWGIYYWANPIGMAKYKEFGDWTGINENANSGIPIKTPFEEKVREWKRKFLNIK